MATPLREVNPEGHLEDLLAKLENQFIDEFLKLKQRDRSVFSAEDEASRDLRRAAVKYATEHLAEIQARGRYVHNVHGASGK